MRTGFHRTTMQDVAGEAGMSPGNLYRYFPSKDDIVVGLAERDLAGMGRDFDELAAADDFMASLGRIGRKHFIEEPRERAILCLEIWAEATRNEVFARMSAQFERETIGQMAALFFQAQARGAVARDVDPHLAATVVSTLAKGLFVRRAIMPDFEAGREVSHVLAVIKAMLNGSIAFPARSEAPGGSS